MKTWPLVLAAVLALGGCAPQQQAPKAGAANPILSLSLAERRRVQMAGPQMLFWSDALRAERFRAMERQFPGTVAAPARRPRALPAGPPLNPVSEAEIDGYMAAQNLAGLIVLQDGKVRLERYRMGLGPRDRWTSFSVAKSLTSTLAGQALKEGRIASLDDPVVRYVPELKGSAYDGVTVRQILTMQSGVRWNEDYADPASDVARMFSEPLVEGRDPALTFLAKLPREAQPGERWVYKTGETNLIGTIVQRATGQSLTDYAAKKLVPAIGFEGELFWMLDPVGSNIGGCCLSLTLRDYARFGQFALEGGAGVVPKDWFADATREHAGVGAPGFGYGYQWWTYPAGMWGAQGIFGQAITVIPAKRAVIVQVGNWPRASDPVLRREMVAFFGRLAARLDPVPGRSGGK